MDGGTNGATLKSKPPLFSFLSRRAKNQVEPDGNSSPPSVDPELPHVEDLFQCATTSQSVGRSDEVVVAPATSSFKNTFLTPRGPFSLCCSNDDRAVSTPVMVRYNSHNNLHKSMGNNRHRRSHSNYKDNLAYESTEIDRRFYSPPPPAPIADPNERPRSRRIDVQPCELDEVTDTLHNLRNCSNYSASSFDKRTDYYRQNTYNSIAISACRSRLREKLLPPVEQRMAHKQQVQHVQQNHITTSSSSDGKEDLFTISSAHSTNEMVHSNQATATNCTTRETTNTPPHCETANHQDQRPASTDSLARQALMAAQVLHLIPTERARTRSLAHTTTEPGGNTLLGQSELNKILPNREVKIFVGTWNMNGEPPPTQMIDFMFPLGIEHVPDIIVMGTQEACSERFEYEVLLQKTLGPSHILFHSAALGTLHLVVFMRRDLVWFASLPEEDSFSVRPGTAFRTKGAVAISFCLFGTSFLFVTSHLTAHQAKVKERVQDIRRITHSLDLPRNFIQRKKNQDVTQNFDSVYWCGDLNFRLAEPREKLLQWIETTQFPLPEHLPHGYMHTDQLKNVLADGAAFKGFKEANILFPPTYKYDVGTQQFDTSSKQRAPAYTDRILYKYRTSSSVLRRGSMLISSGTPPPHPIECLAYDSVQSIITSDHKPVWALFRNYIRPGVDTMPLAAGLFNRDVYLEAMKRRVNDDTVASSSGVCTIQ